MNPVGIILGALAVYVAVGAIFAVPFAFVGVGRIDPVARHAPPAFRLVILPGSAALWPLLLVKWRRARAAGSSPDSP